MKRSFLVFGLAVLLLSGCTSIFDREPVPYEMESYSMRGSSGTMMLDASDNIEAVKMTGDMDESMMAPIEDRKLIKTADLSLHVEDVRAAVTQVTEAVEAKEGNVINSNVVRGEKSYSAYMNVKVPADVLDETLVELKALALYVESENSNASDVTEYYVDLEARLTNKQAEEQQYLSILKQATDVTDTLAVTQALSNVRYEIESLQAQIKGYDSQIDYSSISLSLSEDDSAEAVSETWNPGGTVESARSDFVLFVQGAVDALIYAAVFGVPLLVLLLILWALRRAVKRKK